MLIAAQTLSYEILGLVRYPRRRWEIYSTCVENHALVQYSLLCHAVTEWPSTEKHLKWDKV